MRNFGLSYSEPFDFEAFFVNALKPLKVYKHIPENPPYPYLTYDRISTSYEYEEGIDEARFAFDVFGGNTKQVLATIKQVTQVFNNLENNDDNFVIVGSLDIRDSTTRKNEAVYTMYGNFRYIK